MAHKLFMGLVIAGMLLVPSFATATPILNGWSLYVDGSVLGSGNVAGTLPPYVTLDTTSIDLGDPQPPNYLGGSGIGTMTLTLALTTGTHSVGLWVDHAIDSSAFVFWNESGSVTGSPSLYQQYQIDEPGYLFGTIQDDLNAGNLKNTNSVPAGSEDDVSMALLYRNFTLTATQSATVSFMVSFVQPTSGFYLSQTGFLYEPDGVTPTTNSQTLYFSSSLDIQDSPDTASVPEPGTFASGFAVLALGFGARLFRRARS